MSEKKFVECELGTVDLIYGKSTLLTDIEKIFNNIRIKYKEYTNLKVDFDEWEGNSDRGYEPYSKLYFYGDRLETDDEYRERLVREEKQRLRKIELDKEEAEREKIRQAHQKDFDKQTFDRLKEKYGW